MNRAFSAAHLRYRSWRTSLFIFLRPGTQTILRLRTSQCDERNTEFRRGTRPRVPFPASRRKAVFGETLRQLPDGTRMLPSPFNPLPKRFEVQAHLESFSTNRAPSAASS